MWADGDACRCRLEKIYLDLADNYRESSQLLRRKIARPAGMDDRAVAALK